MEIKSIESLQESTAVFQIIKDIRTHLDLESYLETLSSAKEQGYQLLGLYEKEQCLALMGFRTLVDFVHGKHLYIDDLVVVAERRSQGLGVILLKHAEDLARSLNCKQVRLCTGIENERAKKFYENNNWNLRAIVYKKKL